MAGGGASPSTSSGLPAQTSEGLMALRLRPSSPASPAAAHPLDIDDLLREILHRLPPLPHSLPLASLVCKRWRRLISDPGFRRHHRKPPVLGYFTVGNVTKGSRRLSFTHAVDPPDRIPAAFSPPPLCPGDDSFRLLDCRHGLVLMLGGARWAAIAWNPITGDQVRVPLPWVTEFFATGAVLRAAGNDYCKIGPFKLVFICHNWGTGPPFVRLYRSESGTWVSITSTTMPGWVSVISPSILVGNVLYWSLFGGSILEFDMDTNSLAVIEKSEGIHITTTPGSHILWTADNALGIAVLSGPGIQLWKRKAYSDGAVRWVLQNIIQLNKISRREPLIKITGKGLLGFAEDAVLFLWWSPAVFMIQLETLQFQKISDSSEGLPCYPYTSFFTSGRGIGGAYDDTEKQYKRFFRCIC
ncbi:hypothetical protein ACP70R_019775 [Stipagrostis hirtigluma subsp. patula]